MNAIRPRHGTTRVRAEALAALLAVWLPTAACSSSGSTDHSSPDPGTGNVGGTFMPFGAGGSVTGAGGTTGAAGGTTGAAGDGSGGTIVVVQQQDAGPYPYDPNTKFDWPEADRADASASSHCKAGHYVGTYSCTVTYADAGVYALTGPVDLRLAEAQNGEFLSVSGGTLASAAGILALNASLVGQLNCETGAFSGTLQNGTLSIPPFPPGGTFSGSLNAGFGVPGPKLDGTWTLIGEAQFAGYVCHGPWTANWQAQ